MRRKFRNDGPSDVGKLVKEGMVLAKLTFFVLYMDTFYVVLMCSDLASRTIFDEKGWTDDGGEFEI